MLQIYRKYPGLQSILQKKYMRAYSVSVSPIRCRNICRTVWYAHSIFKKYPPGALSVQGNLLKVFQCRLPNRLYLSGGSKDPLQES